MGEADVYFWIAAGFFLVGTAAIASGNKPRYAGIMYIISICAAIGAYLAAHMHGAIGR